MATFVVLGPLPPPIHGMANVNKAVAERARIHGLQVRTVSTSPKLLDRSPQYYLNRLLSFVRSVFILLFGASSAGRSERTLYMSVSGGHGQIFEIILLLFGRLVFPRIILHHHSYAYINTVTFKTKVLKWVAGRRAVHIFLSKGMSEAFEIAYSKVDLKLIISNAAFVRIGSVERSSEERTVGCIGFLSNISAAKGIREFCDIVDRLFEDRIPVTAILAGPFDDERVEAEVLARISSNPLVSYVGPVSGASKDEFFSRIDVLVFPTNYRNEAEPLTILEALSCGKPVISKDRGCIREMMGANTGFIVGEDSDFVDAACGLLRLWYDNPSHFTKLSESAAQRFQDLRNAANLEIGNIFDSDRSRLA